MQRLFSAKFTPFQTLLVQLECHFNIMQACLNANQSAETVNEVVLITIEVIGKLVENELKKHIDHYRAKKPMIYPPDLKETSKRIQNLIPLSEATRKLIAESKSISSENSVVFSTKLNLIEAKLVSNSKAVLPYEPPVYKPAEANILGL